MPSIPGVSKSAVVTACGTLSSFDPFVIIFFCFFLIFDLFFVFLVLITLLFLKTKKVKLDSLYFLSDGQPEKATQPPNSLFLFPRTSISIRQAPRRWSARSHVTNRLFLFIFIRHPSPETTGWGSSSQTLLRAVDDTKGLHGRGGGYFSPSWLARIWPRDKSGGGISLLYSHMYL